MPDSGNSQALNRYSYGYNNQQGRWLIAESKGSDLDQGWAQLENTMSALFAKTPTTAGSIDLRMYMKATQYENLLAGRMLGWTVRNGILGWLAESGQFVGNINGVDVVVLVAP